jgi:hypothetical protein
MSFRFIESNFSKMLGSSQGELAIFMGKVGRVAKTQGQVLSKQRLSKNVGGKGPSNYHRGPNVPGKAPGRTGVYDTKFYFRRGFGAGPVVLFFGNSAEHAKYIEGGVSKKNYPIEGNLYFWSTKSVGSSPANKYVKASRVIHPGPFGTNPAKSPRLSTLEGARGPGAYIVTDALGSAFKIVSATYRFN